MDTLKVSVLKIIILTFILSSVLPLLGPCYKKTVTHNRKLTTRVTKVRGNNRTIRYYRLYPQSLL